MSQLVLTAPVQTSCVKAVTLSAMELPLVMTVAVTPLGKVPNVTRPLPVMLVLATVMSG